MSGTPSTLDLVKTSGPSSSSSSHDLKDKRQGCSNITRPVLFKKILDPSDFDRKNCLTIPRKDAKAHFPPVKSVPIPITIQDPKGKKWSCFFKASSTNNFKLKNHVLSNIQGWRDSMRFKVGDTVTFCQTDCEDRFIVGRIQGPGSEAVSSNSLVAKLRKTIQEKDLQIEELSNKLELQKEKVPASSSSSSDVIMFDTFHHVWDRLHK